MTALSIIEVFAATGAALGTWKGGEWIIKRFFPTKKEKRQDEASVKQTEVIAEKAVRAMYEETIKDMREEYTARLTELREANKHLNSQVTEMLKAGARKDEIIADKVNKIRELEEQRVQDAKENGRLSKLVLFYRSWHCEREYGNGKEDCKRRKPAQNPPLKYISINSESVSSGIYIRENAPELTPKPKE